MDLHMFRQASFLPVSPPTHRTAEGLFSGVNPHVNFQVPAFDETFAAHAAHVGFLALVNFHVLPEATVPREALPADGALVRLFSCVTSHVSLQVSLIAKFLPTL